MAFFDFRLTIDGDEVVAQRFKIASRKLLNFAEPLGNIGEMMLKDFDRNFTSEGAFLEDRWQQLAPSTLYEKSRKYPGKGILERTGKLRKSFEYRTRKESVILFNRTEYFPYHQLGSPSTNLPKRVMMKVTGRQQAKIAEQFTKYLNKIGL